MLKEFLTWLWHDSWQTRLYLGFLVFLAVSIVANFVLLLIET
jgi:hypothetical protein